MQAYEYQALTDQGGTTRGVLQADSARAARGQLRERGLIPLEVSAVAGERRGGWRPGGYSRERALLLRQMSTLLAAGLPLAEVLTILVEQSDQAAVRRQLGAIRSRVMEGRSLSAAMEGHPRLFPELYAASIAAAERAGRLEQVLGALAEHAERREAMRRGFSLALIYPLMLVIIALAVVWGLIGHVVPRIVGVFEHTARELPWLTRSLMALAEIVGNWGWLLVVLVVLVAGAVIWVRRQPAWRRRLDRLLLRLPVIGRVLITRETATFTRTLAILAASGVPLVEALRVAARVIANRVIRDDISAAAAQVREGMSLSQALDGLGWLAPTTRRLIRGGEKSGELAPMLEHAAAIGERELDAAGSVLLSVLQPVLILLVGLVVLYIVLAVMLPIMNMSQLLS